MNSGKPIIKIGDLITFRHLEKYQQKQPSYIVISEKSYSDLNTNKDEIVYKVYGLLANVSMHNENILYYSEDSLFSLDVKILNEST